MMFLCKFGQNLAIVSEDRVLIELYDTVDLENLVKATKKLIKSKYAPNYLHVPVHLLVIIWRLNADKAFLFSNMTLVTLRIRSRSPKPNQFFAWRY